MITTNPASSAPLPPLEKLAYSVDEARARVGISRNSIYKEISAGRLKVTKIGRRSIILADDLRAWLAALRGGAR